MNTKLTLSLEQDIIEKAKIFAKQNQTSLSKLIENYLQKITDQSDEKAQITPLVRSLSGIIDIPVDYKHKDGYADYLISKYQ